MLNELIELGRKVNRLILQIDILLSLAQKKICEDLWTAYRRTEVKCVTNTVKGNSPRGAHHKKEQNSSLSGQCKNVQLTQIHVSYTSTLNLRTQRLETTVQTPRRPTLTFYSWACVSRAHWCYFHFQPNILFHGAAGPLIHLTRSFILKTKRARTEK